MGQAFKKQRSGKTDTNFFWHLNQHHDAMVLDQNKCNELEEEPLKENEQIWEKEQDQDQEDRVEKEQDNSITEPHEDMEGACDLNDNGEEFDGNAKALDSSFSSCSSEIVVVSESE